MQIECQRSRKRAFLVARGSGETQFGNRGSHLRDDGLPLARQWVDDLEVSATWEREQPNVISGATSRVCIAFTQFQRHIGVSRAMNRDLADARRE